MAVVVTGVKNPSMIMVTSLCGRALSERDRLAVADNSNYRYRIVPPEVISIAETDL